MEIIDTDIKRIYGLANAISSIKILLLLAENMSRSSEVLAKNFVDEAESNYTVVKGIWKLLPDDLKEVLKDFKIPQEIESLKKDIQAVKNKIK